MDSWETRARQALEDAAERLGCTVDTFFEEEPTYITHLETENNRLMAANGDLLETIRTLRLDIETYKSTLEGLQRRVVRFEHLGNLVGEIV